MDETKIVNKLKTLINKNGPDYLYNAPYLTYQELTESGSADSKTAGAILLVLARNADIDVKRQDDSDELAKLIQKECCFNKKMADKLAKLFIALYSKDNKETWEEKKLDGWSQFVKAKFSFTWNGDSAWLTSGGCVDCHFEAKIILKPRTTITADKELYYALKENPFMTKKRLQNTIRKNLLAI